MSRASQYSPSARKRAAVAVVVHGTSKAAGQAAAIPPSTIRDWRNNDPDFAALCTEAQVQFNEQLEGQLVKIIELAHANTLDRLQHGDETVDTKTGRRIRLPVKARDCAVIGAIAIDKLRILQGMPTTITESRPSLLEIRDQLIAVSESQRSRTVAVQERESE